MPCRIPPVVAIVPVAQHREGTDQGQFPFANRIGKYVFTDIGQIPGGFENNIAHLTGLGNGKRVCRQSNCMRSLW
jgi:hypothetical protein